MACNLGTPIKLSASLGGEPIALDTPTVPGQTVHANPLSAGNNHVVQDLQVTNRNPNTISLYLTITGPGIIPPTSQNDMRRFDIVPSEEGRSSTRLPVPIILAPGYEIVISTTLPPGGTPLLLDGMACEATGTGTTPGNGGTPSDTIKGYGGMSGTDNAAPGSIPSSPSWATVPFDDIASAQYENVTPSPGTDTISLDIAGVWQMAVSLTISHTSSNQGRTFLARLFNMQTNQPITIPVPVSIARDQTVTTVSYIMQFQPDEAVIDDPIRIEVQSEGSAITVTNWDATEIGFVLLNTIAPVVDEGDIQDHTGDPLVDHTGDQLRYVG